jgi:integrase
MASLIKRQFKSGSVWYIQYWEGGKQKRIRAHESERIAEQMKRDFEDAQAQGDASLAFPSRTPIASIVSGYVEHIRTAKTPKSAQTDIYYLRDAFGPICDALNITSRKVSLKVKKRPPKPGQDRRRKSPVIAASHFEAITTAQIATFISGRMASRGLKPKTGNRIRDTLSSLFSWAIKQRGIRMPGEKNPVSAVAKYKESAPEIRYLTREQITFQLEALTEHVQLQAMAATLIYAGLRREELTWLTNEDLDLAAGKHGMIRIRAKTIANEFWQPKTKKNRAVPISSQLRHYLDKWRLKHHGGKWLFPNSVGGRYDPDNFASDLRALNVKKEVGWKDEEGDLFVPFGCLHFRHTFGSTLAQRGVSLYQISALMGNSPEIARRHYAALLPEAMADLVEFETNTIATAPANAQAVSA